MVKAKVVFDTNVWISALFFGGTPKEAIDLALKRCQIFCSVAILQELREVLAEDFDLSQKGIEELTESILSLVQILPIVGSLKNILSDPEDHPILETALVAGADYLVTGDRHLLILKKFQNIKIITPTQFLKEF